MLKRTVREQYPTRPILFPVCKQLQRPPFKRESSVICCGAVTFDSSESVCSLCLLPFFNYASRTRLIAFVTYTESSEEGTGKKNPRNPHPQCEGKRRAEDLCARAPAWVCACVRACPQVLQQLLALYGFLFAAQCEWRPDFWLRSLFHVLYPLSSYTQANKASVNTMLKSHSIHCNPFFVAKKNR